MEIERPQQILFAQDLIAAHVTHFAMSGDFRSEAIEQFSIKGLGLKFVENSARTFTRKLIVACQNRSPVTSSLVLALLGRRERPCLSCAPPRSWILSVANESQANRKSFWARSPLGGSVGHLRLSGWQGGDDGKLSAAAASFSRPRF